MNFDSVQMLLPFIHDIVEKNEYTKILASYKDCYLSDMTLDVYENVRKNFTYGYINEQAERVANCGRHIFFDVAEKQKVKIYQNLVLCKDRFCPNCQKQRQLTRLFRFGAILDEFAQTHDLYHMVLTVPNCSGEMLKRVLAKIHSAFTKFINMFLVGENRKKKARREFKHYGCVAALRSTEITYDKGKRSDGEEYHPHLHCIIALSRDLELPKHYVHKKFSYDYTKGKKLVRYFSKLELRLQKIWYLIFNGYKYSRKNYDEIVGEYSVTLDKVDNNTYYEVFKYATKMYDEKSNMMDYEQFKTLRISLDGRRTMQGYGSWYNMVSNDDIEDEAHQAEKIIVAYLSRTEDLERVCSSTDEVMKDMVEKLEYLYLNFKLIHNIGNEDIERLLEVGTSADIWESMKKLKHKRIENDINKRVEHFKEIYYTLRHRYPNEIEILNFKDTLYVDSSGRVRQLKNAEQLTMFGIKDGEMSFRKNKR